jgi:oxygenase
VLFAGDAAHQQMPIGGQALNLGLQDAVNLGWKLALHVRGLAPQSLLDTYHTERHAVGERVLANIRAQALLLLGDPEVEPLRGLLGALITDEANRVRLAGMISGLDIRYDGGDGDGGGHQLVGARLPEMALTASPSSGGPATTTEQLRTGRGLLVDLTGGAAAGQITHSPLTVAEPWFDRVTAAAAARPDQAGALDGTLDGADAVLVRPDGYVAWAGSAARDGSLADALRRWFGPPRQESENPSKGRTR